MRCANTLLRERARKIGQQGIAKNPSMRLISDAQFRSHSVVALSLLDGKGEGSVLSYLR